MSERVFLEIIDDHRDKIKNIFWRPRLRKRSLSLINNTHIWASEALHTLKIQYHENSLRSVINIILFIT